MIYLFKTAAVGLLVTLLLCCSLVAASPPCRTCIQAAQPTYYAAPQVVEEVRVREVLVPILQPLAFFADPRISYHYGIGSYVPALQAAVPQQPAVQHQPAQQAAKTDNEIDSLIDRIEKRVQERNRFQNQQQEPEGPPPVPGANQLAARSIITERCAECHTGQAAKGGFQLFSAPGVPSNTADVETAWDAIRGGRMPPRSRQPLSPTEKQQAASELGINPQRALR